MPKQEVKIIKLTSIVKGFNEKEILPTGGGRNGEWFGSALPDPTGFLVAISPGVMFMPILIKPPDLPSSLPFVSI